MKSSVEEVRRLSTITENLLTLARSDAGAISPEPAEVDAREVVAHIAARLEPVAHEAGVVIRLGEEPVPVRVDPGLLGQVAWNLVENALRFSPSGEEVSVQVEPGEAGGDAVSGVTITVLDRGPGLGKNPDAVFQRFFREDPARTRGGSGLGLAIVEAIAKAHAGGVRASNREGGGARISATLRNMKAP
jgi:signal transduction histidine kinase